MVALPKNDRVEQNMTELELMRHAKEDLDKPVNGSDPISWRELPEGDVVNHVRFSRCLFYVSGVLRQVIENCSVMAWPV